MIRRPFNLDPLLWPLLIAGGVIVVLEAIGAASFPLWVLIAAVVVAVIYGIREAALLLAALRERRRVRRARAAEATLVETRLAEVRELRPTDELDRAVDPTPGTIRRARQSRGRRTPRARKRRTGRWG